MRKCEDVKMCGEDEKMQEGKRARENVKM